MIGSGTIRKKMFVSNISMKNEMIKEFDKTKTFWMFMAVSLVFEIIETVLFPILVSKEADLKGLCHFVLIIAISSLIYLVSFFVLFKTNLKSKIKNTDLFLNIIAFVLIFASIYLT